MKKINDQTFKSKHLDLARSGQQNMQIKSSNILEIATLEGGEHWKRFVETLPILEYPSAERHKLSNQFSII